ncbi:hypothetical protein PAXRUDRAFT_587829 [Paxillus rubicundulus Ve08.2h10]|uniref:Uncharacterized protein n=1 Tax=Paxillus rubicundulus Ve08.2h10 TaxID=930991 RepID=A0A0D0ECB9_9AGAM|nr:hypothetical protein PAXRUDRAFT_587829 [Paxillus rubicundulus Ve08.2h10]
MILAPPLRNAPTNVTLFLTMEASSNPGIQFSQKEVLRRAGNTTGPCPWMLLTLLTAEDDKAIEDYRKLICARHSIGLSLRLHSLLMLRVFLAWNVCNEAKRAWRCGRPSTDCIWCLKAQSGRLVHRPTGCCFDKLTSSLAIALVRMALQNTYSSALVIGEKAAVMIAEELGIKNVCYDRYYISTS